MLIVLCKDIYSKSNRQVNGLEHYFQVQGHLNLKLVNRWSLVMSGGNSFGF